MRYTTGIICFVLKGKDDERIVKHQKQHCKKLGKGKKAVNHLMSITGIILVFADPLLGGIFGFAWLSFVMLNLLFTARGLHYGITTATVYMMVNAASVFAMDADLAIKMGFFALIIAKVTAVVIISTLFLKEVFR